VVRDHSANDRKRLRQQRSRPLVKAMDGWLREQLDRLSGRATPAQSIRYAVNHWDGRQGLAPPRASPPCHAGRDDDYRRPRAIVSQLQVAHY